MSKKLLRFFMLGALLLAGSAGAEPKAGEDDLNAKPGVPPEVSRADLSALRQFHEGARYTLQRFATVEALVGALQRERQENQAFLIGAASLIPGAGQMINGDYLEGSLLLFADSMSGVTANQLAYTRRDSGLGPEHFALAFVRDGIVTYATLHAANASYREQHDRTRAMWTGMASLVPGAGQAVNGDWWEAGGLFAAWAVCAALTTEMERQHLNGQEPLTAQDETTGRWSLAWLPGGAGLRYSQSW